MKFVKNIFLWALAGLSAGAFAADPGWFGGIRIGSPGIDASVAAQAEDPDVSLSVFNVPIRLKLGTEIGLREPVLPGTGLRLGDDRLGWQVLGVGSVPITKNWGVFGKLGAHRWGADVNPGFGAVGTTDPRPTYGLGLKYDFSNNLTVSGEWDRYRMSPGNGLRPDGEVDLLSIGLKYKF